MLMWYMASRFWMNAASINRPSWSCVFAGCASCVLFFLPLLISVYAGVSFAMQVVFAVAWLSSGAFGLMALHNGFVANYRSKDSQRSSFLLTVFGAAMGLAMLVMLGIVLVALLLQWL